MLTRQNAHVTRTSPPWTDPRAVAGYLATEIPALVSDEMHTTIVWAAGVGHIGASAASLRAETAGVAAVCASVRQLSAKRRERVSLLFASSAGALFGGHGDGEVSDDTEPHPITTYGHEKLQHEDSLHRLWQDTGCRVVICRISNLFGLAQGRVTPRGLVSAAVRSTRLRQPMTIYVSPDTRRDYIYNADAAAVSLHLLHTAATNEYRTELVREGTTRTVSEVLSLVGSVCGRRVPANYAERPETRLQPRVLRFSRPVQGPKEVRRTPMEAAIHSMVRAPMLTA